MAVKPKYGKHLGVVDQTSDAHVIDSARKTLK
jgi:hypothetical protein